jgi:hypothetical protein
MRGITASSTRPLILPLLYWLSVTKNLSLELRHIAAGDEDVRLLMTIPGVGYYIALLVKAEVGRGPFPA